MSVKQLQIGEIIKSRENCKVLSDRSPIRYVMEEMARHQFLSFPLQDNKGAYVGITNIGDICAFVVGFVLEKAKEKDEKIDSVALERLDWDVANCLGLSEESQTLWEFPLETPVEKVLEVFHKGIHRILISNADHTIVKLFSQTDLVRHIVENQEKFPEALSQTVLNADELNPGKIELHMIKETDQASLAFFRMIVYGVRTIPIVNSAGKIVGDISQQDLRGLEPTEIKRILLPVPEFLESVKRSLGKHRTCKGDIKVKEAAEFFVKEKIPALWVVDEEGKPLRSITLTDLIARIAPY